MNKTVIDNMIPKAVEALANNGIAVNGKISKTYRGQISTFGAAISGGSLLAAVSFFSAVGEASVDRTKLVGAIYEVVTGTPTKDKVQLFKYVQTELNNKAEASVREDILNAAIALKLAMNVYVLEKG